MKVTADFVSASVVSSKQFHEKSMMENILVELFPLRTDVPLYLQNMLHLKYGKQC